MPQKKMIPEFIELPHGRKIKNHARHDFDKPTKLLLQHLAAGVCSNPTCLNHTIGSNIERNNYSGNGQAAHICAAAPGRGAARYDENQSESERRSYSNGIWLCASCATIIDSDEARYPISLLHKWKETAERRAMSLIGQKSITPYELSDSVNKAIINTTQSIYESNPSSKLKTVQNLSSYETYLNSLDKRFSVKVIADSKSLTHKIHAKEGETPIIEVIVTSNFQSQMDKAWQRMWEDGASCEISTANVEFKGSPLFQSLLPAGKDGKITIGPIGSTAPVGIYLANKNSEFELATVEANIVQGTKKLIIQGSALDGLFRFKYQYAITKSKVNYDFNFSLDPWINREIRNLPHFRKLLKASKFIQSNDNLTISLRIHSNNDEISMGEDTAKSYRTLLEEIKDYIFLIEKSATLASKFNTNLTFKNFKVSPTEANTIIRHAEALDGAVIDAIPEGEQITTAILKDVPRHLMKAMETHTLNSGLKFVEPPRLNFFGNDVTLPTMSTHIDDFELNLFSTISGNHKKSLVCAIYATKLTRAIRYLADDEPYVLNK